MAMLHRDADAPERPLVAQRREGLVDAAHAVQRVSDAEFTFLDLLTQLSGVVLQHLSINLARIAVTGAVLRPTPVHERLRAIGMHSVRGEVATRKQLLERL